MIDSLCLIGREGGEEGRNIESGGFKRDFTSINNSRVRIKIYRSQSWEPSLLYSVIVELAARRKGSGSESLEAKEKGERPKQEGGEL